jgi:hypothetical protein
MKLKFVDRVYENAIRIIKLLEEIEPIRTK